MSEFTVPVVEIRAIEPIPNADAIELAVVGEYRSVVRKGDFEAGQRAVYLPESAIIPAELLETLGLTGKLSGGGRNRVKAIKLRGCLSQGILLGTVPPGLAIGDDAAEVLGIEKFNPKIPSHMAGRAANLFGYPLKYDIDNYKAHPWLIEDGEAVEFTEKAHGTFCGIAVHPDLDRDDLFGRNGFIYSKGLGAKGIVFENTEENASNVYIQAEHEAAVLARIRTVFPGQAVHVLGEIYGRGVQDLHYGRADKHFAVFDINVDGAYLCRDALDMAVIALGLPRVPVLYRGPFSREVLYEHTDGKTVIGNGAHIREGVVVTPLVERTHTRHGRVILKSVSGDYLTRKGETTEFT